ncbi:hypothetical protein D9M71_509690 [compost metagenome]
MGFQAHAQVRVQPAERLQRRGEDFQPVLDGGGNAQAALQASMLGARLVDGDARIFDHLQAALVKALAGISEGNSAGGAGQQGHAQFSFQLLDAEADGGAGLLQALGGAGEGAGLDHRAEQFESVETDHAMPSPLSK